MSESLKAIAELWQEHGDIDMVVERTYSLGMSKLETIKLLHTTCGLSLRDAKRTLASSSKWEDANVASNALHDVLESSLDHYDAVPKKREPE